MKSILEATNVNEIQEIIRALMPDADEKETPADILEHIQACIDYSIELGHKEGKTPPPQTMGCAIAKEAMRLYPDRVDLDHALRIATAVAFNIKSRNGDGDLLGMLEHVLESAAQEEGECSNDR